MSEEVFNNGENENKREVVALLTDGKWRNGEEKRSTEKLPTMEVEAAAVGSVMNLIPRLLTFLDKQVRYVKDLPDHVSNLKRGMKELQSKCHDIQARIQEAKRQLQIPTNEVENWVTEVAKIEKEVNSIKSDFDKMRLCFNLKARYKLGKKAIRNAKIVVDLIGKGDFDVVAVCPSPPRGVEMPTTTTTTTYGQKSYAETLWSCLHDEKYAMVCVHGMGGVGKTTLMRTINNRLVGTRCFDVVIYVTVSKDLNIKRIQLAIGSKLGLPSLADDEDQESRGRKIFESLKNLRYVMMLDDLWEEISLDDVGIPKPNTENKCKIVLSTRFLRVSRSMDADKWLKVKPLGGKEAWNLFHEKAGEVVLLPDIKALAVEVVKECGGLPLAIITVGRAMRGKGRKQVWQHALWALKESVVPEIEGMEPIVFRSLKLSYDYLEDDIKRCFLYCALYPDDYKIECRSEESPLKESLLEESNSYFVKMHDLIRDLAIWITSSLSVEQGQKFLVKAGMGIKEAPQENMWEGVERVSLMVNDIKRLPTRPNCPTLVSLFLQKNHVLGTIPSSFFELMPRLGVLDLSDTNIESLPIYSYSLVNLRVLILSRCHSLIKVPPLKHLTNLQFLDLRECSRIGELPQSIGELVNLKSLDLSYLPNVTTIPPSTICCLSSLQQLITIGTPIEWAKDENEGTSCSLAELATLTHLDLLDITVKDFDCLAQDSFQLPTLSKFHLEFGKTGAYKFTLPTLHINKKLCVYDCESFPLCFKIIQGCAEGLGIYSCEGLTQGISEIAGDSLTLRNLDIAFCLKVDCIIDNREVGHNIEWMKLSNLPNLKKLIVEDGSLSLRQLKTFDIGSCERLSGTLFSSNLVQHLNNLESFRIANCDKIVEIIEEPILNDALPSLRKLRILGLKGLKSICNPKVSFTSLQEMEIAKCPKLKKLPRCPRIQIFKAEKKWIEELDWDTQYANWSFRRNYPWMILESPVDAIFQLVFRVLFEEGKLKFQTRLLEITASLISETLVSFFYVQRGAAHFIHTTMEAVAQVAGETIAQQVRSFRDLSANVENLKREMKELKSKWLDIKARIREAERQVLRPKNQVLNWVTEVDNIEEDINSINSEFDQMSRFNLKSRYELGKKVIRMTEIVVNLKDRGDFDEVAVCPSPPRVLEMPTTSTHGQESYEETLWRCLHDENYSMVCVHGMGGVGKTTLMKTINNKLVGTRDFDVVIWVTVSKDLNIERTQLAIGSKLGLLFGGDEDQESRGRKIFARLKNSRYVLLLDDLWEEIILDDVGIPKPDKVNKCKIVLSTRFLRVSNDMDVDMQFKVKILGDEEAWNLFDEKTGEVVHLPDIQALAVEVVKECGGLPLAIITVGRAMRGKERKKVWLDALRALKESAVPEIDGMEPKVFRSLKLSYDCLEEDNIKPCFLYCALYPEDTEIYVPELVEYWTMEGFANNVDNLEDASNKGHRIIERLKDACLLEVLVEDYVKMHDLIRDLAIWITSSSMKEGPKFLVKAGMGLKEAPKENMWEGVERVSLMRNQIERLPTRPNCPTLVSLFLQQNDVLRTIPSSFFELMPQLRVLDLSYTHIESLPMSLSSLVNLRALILRNCHSLMKVPPLGHLKHLQFLNLRACDGIRELPQGIGELVNLESLDLSYLSRVTTIPCTTICSLSSLEELSMIGTPIKWAKEGGLEDVNEGTGYSVAEQATLTHLYSLDITVTDIDCLSQDSFHRRQLSSLRKFNFQFGKIKTLPFQPDGDKKLCVNECEYFPPCCKIIQEYADSISISACKGLKRGISEIGGHSLTLRNLRIANCPQVDCIIDNGDVGHNIEWMRLSGLSNLKKLIMGHGSLSLRQLKTLSIDSCEKLSGTLFSSNVVHQLDKLEHLGIRDCDKIEEIIEEGDNMLVLNNALPSLCSLRLEGLKGLRSICSSRVSFTSLEHMSINRCTKLKKLPSCPSIQKFNAEREWFEELNWEDGENTKSLFTNALEDSRWTVDLIP
ncbi:uncharacterized protein LOC143855827 [Tasmannia lanceolata]|uniref:uncharacterized protein LOC143855827 n=1 Tax=Tasmannia lanceolata TaxID=3420 RepID=UPI0040638DBD